MSAGNRVIGRVSAIGSAPRQLLSFTALALVGVVAASGCSSSGKQAQNGASSTSDGSTPGNGGNGNGGSGNGNGGAATSTGGKGTGATSSGGNGSGGKSGAGGASGASGAGGSGGSVTLGTGSATAHDALAKIGKDHFLIGMGNDLNNNHDQDGAYTLGTTLDVHYAYLVGLKGQGGWTDWNTDGSFVNILTDTAKKHGDVPMFTLYSMAAWGENNVSVLTNDSYMQAYWDGAKLLFQRLAMFGDPSIVQFEPDWWGYAEQAAGNDPTKVPVHVSSLAPDCKSLSDDLVGMGKCLVTLARTYSPKTIVGFHASVWADPDPSKIATFLLAIGAGSTDFVTTDTLDRDAGCFEAHTDPNCQRTGNFYWDESNQTSPNFHEHLAWVKTITQAMGKPMLWWQTPFGVPSTTPGGTAGHYRDNRVHYIFSHIDEFVAAGGMGVVFGTGAGNQTYIDSDGDEFKTAVASYFTSPTPL
jgi:hypothetical protein